MEESTILEKFTALGFVPGKNRHHPRKIKELAVELLDGGYLRITELSRVLQISRKSLSDWRDLISPRVFIQRERKTISSLERRQVLNAVASGMMSKKEGMRQLEITHKKITLWLEDQNLHLRDSEHGTLAMGNKKNQTDESLQKEIDRLNEELAQEKLKVESLKTMIEIAEKELKVNIRKKSGTK